VNGDIASAHFGVVVAEHVDAIATNIDAPTLQLIKWLLLLLLLHPNHATCIAIGVASTGMATAIVVVAIVDGATTCTIALIVVLISSVVVVVATNVYAANVAHVVVAATPT